MAGVALPLFQEIQLAAWLWTADGQLIAETQRGTLLRQQYQIIPEKLLEIAQGKGCLKHGLQADCLDCPVARSEIKDHFPFELKAITGESDLFWGQLTVTDQQWLLQIAPPPAAAPQSPDRSLFEYLNNARELERKRIAQDLHDGIAQSIYSLMLETRLLKWLPPAEQLAKLNEIDTHFAEVLTEVKNLASELRPMSIDEFGLLPALEQFAQRTMEMTGFEVQVETHGSEKPLSENKRIAIYRSIQEAVANALKYANVNQVTVELTFAERLLITIVDEGTGFSQQMQETGFGLMNMRERIQAVGGTIEILSRPQAGTRIYLQIPCDEEKSNK